MKRFVLAIALFVLGCHHRHSTRSTARFATSSDGVKIAYEDVGKGDVTVVMVHCWTCNRHEWDHTRAALSSKWRVVTLDLAGHGDSGKTRAEWTMGAFGDDVRAVADALSLKKIVLVGHSMGGPVIVEAAQKLDGRVVALVAVDTLSNLDAHPNAEKTKPMLDAMASDFRGTSEKIMRSIFGAHSDPKVFDVLLHDRDAVDEKSAVAMARSMFAYDAGAKVAALALPLREINADNHPTNVEGNRLYAHDFDAVILHDVGHWPMRERPAEFEAALAKVLDGLPH